MYNPLIMEGKNIIVTGASSGIGKQCAIVLSKLGAKVILVARNEERLNETVQLMEGNEHKIMALDLSLNDNISLLFSEIQKSELKLNGLVHAAGIGPTIPLRMTDSSVMFNVFNVNYYAFIELCRYFSRRGIAGINPSIVGISSIISMIGRTGCVAYSGSKGAMDASIRTLAIELAPLGIRINSIAPGWVDTEIAKQTIDLMGEESFSKFIAEQPLGLIPVEDIANVIAFLLSDATRKVTGATWVVDGGRNAH